MLDLLIRGGRVIDGTGAPATITDVGVAAGRIVEIGASDEPARRTIDADGLVVCPGFVDVHTHLDAQVFWDPTLSPSPLHGVTTVFGGNCGFTIAPLTSDAATYLMTMLARVEGMPLGALEEGVPWDWKTTAEYLDRIDGTLALNAGFMVGHSTVRRVVMGEAATERAATREEIESMKDLVRAALAAGAMGFSSTYAATHNDASGRPVPSRHASYEETIELAAVCREFPGTSLELLPYAGPRFPDEVVELMTRMSLAAQRPLNWNLLVATADNGDVVANRLAASDYARERGAKIVGLHMPARIAAQVSFYTGFVLDLLPGWQEPMALRPAEKLELLRNREGRGRLAELAASDHEWPWISNWGNWQIHQTFTPETKRHEGRRVSDIAEEEGKAPFDALVDVVCADELRTTFIRPHEETRADWEARAELARDRRTLIGGSDAGAHLDLLGTFNYPTRLLQHLVREEGLLGLEEAIRMLTTEPAALYGLRDRGVLRTGAMADVVVFDPETVGTHELTSRFDLPTGAPRLYAESTGVEHVVVNGVPIVEGTTITDARPGALLRSGRDTQTPSLD